MIDWSQHPDCVKYITIDQYGRQNLFEFRNGNPYLLSERCFFADMEYKIVDGKRVPIFNPMLIMERPK
jgi:hypothetical protein